MQHLLGFVDGIRCSEHARNQTTHLLKVRVKHIRSVLVLRKNVFENLDALDRVMVYRLANNRADVALIDVVGVRLVIAFQFHIVDSELVVEAVPFLGLQNASLSRNSLKKKRLASRRAANYYVEPRR